MNVIYIDVLITVNLFIDYLLLFSVKRLLHIQTKSYRVLLGALFSAMSTPIVFLSFYTEFISVLFKPLISIFSVLIAFGRSDFKRFIIRSIMLWGISMGLCGAMIIFKHILNPRNLIIYRDTLYFNISPVSLILFTLASYIVLTIYEKFKGQHTLKCKTINVTITSFDNKKISFESAVDTGLNLKEPFSGLPVIMAERTLLRHMDIPKEKLRIIPFSTASGDGIVYGFKPKELSLNGKKSYGECYVAITDNRLKGEVKSIMGEELTENL